MSTEPSFEDLRTELVNTVATFWGKVETELSTFVQNIVDELMSIPGEIGDLGRQIANQITESLTGAKNILVDAGVSVGNTVKDAINDTLGIQSPSKELYKTGVWAAQGLADGLEDSGTVNTLTSRAESLGGMIAEGIKYGLTQSGSAINLLTAFDDLGYETANRYLRAFEGMLLSYVPQGSSEGPNTGGTRLQSPEETRMNNRQYATPMPEASAEFINLVRVILPQVSAALGSLASITMPQVVASVGTLTNIAMPQVSAAFNRFVVSDAPRFSAASEHMYSNVLQNAQNETEARRIMLDTQIAQQNAQAVMWQTTLSNIGLGLTNTVGWIGATLGSAVSWVGSSLTTTASWLGGMLSFSGEAWGQTVSWVGSVFTGAADFAWQAITGIGSGLLELASSQIPWLGAMMDGLSGGPVAMLTNLLVSLFGETWQFQEIIRIATAMVEPLIEILGDLISAIWPIIQVLMNNLKIAFEYIGFVVKNVVTPIFSFAAKIIASVYNSLVRAINWALGWLGVHLNEVNVNAGPVNRGFIDGARGQVGSGQFKTGNVGTPTKYRPTGAVASKFPTVQRGEAKPLKNLGGDIGKAVAKNFPKSKMPGYKAPAAPKTKAPSSKAPSTKAPGLGTGKGSKAPSYGGGSSYNPGKGTGGAYGSAADVTRGGGVKVSEITGPTRDLFSDLLSPLVALPELTGIANRTYDLLSQRLGVAPVIAGAAFAGGPTITIENVNLNATGNLDYDLNQFANKIESVLYQRFTTGKRGTGR